MAIKPILFNTRMVQAILEGRKTQTRRLVKQPPVFGDILHDQDGWYYEDGTRNGHSLIPSFSPGDILWVRETWSTHYDGIHDDLQFCYKADGIDLQAECMPGESNRWHPSIHMPKEAARIFLRVKNVRVERLQDITEKDALAEGMPDDLDYPIAPTYCPRCKGEGLIGSHVGYGFVEADCPMCDTAVKRFNNLWNSTIEKADLEKYGWEANPWVWVVEFERCEKPNGWSEVF